MPYWPSYSDIPSVARRTYLQWLAGGRVDPMIGVGYVFLFFYGLERRLFVDGAQDEAPSIIAEVERLLTLYGYSGSFRGYASRFLETASLLINGTVARPELSPDMRNGYEMPLSTRIYLGQKLNAKTPLDGDDCLVWILSLPDTYLRTPATRCFEEFTALWRMRFIDRYPQGLRVTAPKRKIKLEYQPASNTFDLKISVTDSSGSIPDVTAISAPIDGLRDIVNSCTDALDSYSRLLGRKPEMRGTTEALFLLPSELFSQVDDSGAATMPVMAKIQEVFGGRVLANLPVARFLDILGMPLSGDDKISSGTCLQIGAFLDKLDVGFEPDRRYGSSSLTANGRLLLFKAKAGAPVDSEKPGYLAARTLIEIATLAAASDGSIVAVEYESLKSEIRSFPELSPIERARLLAYSNTLLNDVPAQQTAMRKLAKLADTEKIRICQSAMSAVLADGHIATEEVKFLEKLYKVLGYPIESIYSSLHRGAVVIDEPMTIAAESFTKGTPIPAAPEPAATVEPVIRLDAAKMERIKSETLAVSELLAGIFLEDGPEVVRPTAIIVSSADQPEVRYKGLDTAHASLLQALITGNGMDRETFEARARELRLLPDGAIENINEWGFDAFDEIVIEGEENIVVPPHIRSELMKMDTAA